VRRPIALLLAALATLLACAATALAAQTIGPEGPNPDPTDAQAFAGQSGRLLFNMEAPAGQVLATPGAGTITSWRFYTDQVGPEATAQLYALTAAGGGNFTVVAIGPKEPLPAIVPTGPEERNVLHSFTSDIAVPAGSYLGVRVEYPGTSTVRPVWYVQTGWTSGCLGGGCAEPPPMPGLGGSAKAVTYAPREMAMNATFEPAASGGGGGGETTPSCVGSCEAPPSPTPPATTPPADTTSPAKPAPKPLGCKKGQVKKKVKGQARCVKKKPHHRKKSHKS
jgi:hypothetical protein